MSKRKMGIILGSVAVATAAAVTLGVKKPQIQNYINSYFNSHKKKSQPENATKKKSQPENATKTNIEASPNLYPGIVKSLGYL